MVNTILDKTKIIFLLLVSSLLLSTFSLGQASASDFSSFATCNNRTSYKYKDIYQGSRKLGFIRVYKCTGHYFVNVKNTVGSAKSTLAYITSKNTKGTNYYKVGAQITGKYQSVTYLIANPSGTQCFTAVGSVRTYSYGTGGAGMDWCN